MDGALENYSNDSWGISDEWGRFRQLSLVPPAPRSSPTVSNQSDSDQLLEDKSEPSKISSSKMTEPQKLLEDKLDSTEISSLHQRRHKGEGSGCIYWRTVTRNGKDYQQAYYQYEFWEKGDLRSSGEASRLVKSSKYIPKGKLAQVQRLNNEKAPVREILKLLGVIR